MASQRALLIAKVLPGEHPKIICKRAAGSAYIFWPVLRVPFPCPCLVVGKLRCLWIGHFPSLPGVIDCLSAAPSLLKLWIMQRTRAQFFIEAESKVENVQGSNPLIGSAKIAREIVKPFRCFPAILRFTEHLNCLTAAAFPVHRLGANGTGRTRRQVHGPKVSGSITRHSPMPVLPRRYESRHGGTARRI